MKRCVPAIMLGIIAALTIFPLLSSNRFGLFAILLLIVFTGQLQHAWGHHEENSDKSTTLVHILTLGIPIGLLWIMYENVSDGSWMFDDPRILRSAIEFNILPHFYDTDVWRQISSSLLMPWMVLSLGADYHINGLAPTGFYYHHLLSFTLLIIVAYAVLRTTLPPLLTSMVLSIFILTPPCAASVQLLMTRHYVEGLAFTLAAILCYQLSFRKHVHIWSWAGAILYALAMSAKEVFVPLVIVLPLLTPYPWRRKILRLYPYVVAAAGYVFWRCHMLGIHHILAGYGDVHKTSLSDLVSLPTQLITQIGWKSTLIFLVPPALLIFYLYHNIRQRSFRPAVLVLAVAIVVVLPIVPVISILSPRMMLLPSFVLCVGVGLGLNVVLMKCDQWRPVREVIVYIVFGVLILEKSMVEQSTFWKNRTVVDDYRLICEFVLYKGDDDTMLMTDAGSAMYFFSLAWLRENVLGTGRGPLVCRDLCVCKEPGRSIAQGYVLTNGNIEKMHPDDVVGDVDCGRDNAELSVTITYQPGTRTMHWSFGPYQEGQYYYAGPTGRGRVSGHFTPFPRQGQCPYTLPEPLSFSVKYVSPEGWHAYSPVLTINPAALNEKGNATIVWQQQ